MTRSHRAESRVNTLSELIDSFAAMLRLARQSQEAQSPYRGVFTPSVSPGKQNGRFTRTGRLTLPTDNSPTNYSPLLGCDHPYVYCFAPFFGWHFSHTLPSSAAFWQHLCSHFLPASTVGSQHGFLSSAARSAVGPPSKASAQRIAPNEVTSLMSIPLVVWFLASFQLSHVTLDANSGRRVQNLMSHP